MESPSKFRTLINLPSNIRYDKGKLIVWNSNQESFKLFMNKNYFSRGPYPNVLLKYFQVNSLRIFKQILKVFLTFLEIAVVSWTFPLYFQLTTADSKTFIWHQFWLCFFAELSSTNQKGWLKACKVMPTQKTMD